MARDTTCWICTTAPALLQGQWDTLRCRCGATLRWHAFSPPHGYGLRNCDAFAQVIPIEQVLEVVETQLSLIEKGA